MGTDNKIDTLTDLLAVKIELEKINKEQSAILNTLPAKIALLDRDGNIVKVNDEWMKFGRENGINPQYSYIGVNYIDVSKSSTGMDAESGDFMAEGIVSILKGKKEDFSLDYPCHSPNQQRWFRAEVRPLSGNRDAGIVVMHTDITERKRAEEEIKLLINNTEESFILIDNNLKIVSFNNQFQRLYKEYLKLNVKKGDWIIDYAQPERKEIVTAIYKKVLNGHVEMSEITVPVTVENVRTFSLKYSPAKDVSGSIFGVFVTISDITDKKKAEQLKEFEKRDKEALINNTDDLIWSVTPDIKLIAANNSFIKSMERYYGIIIKSGDSLFIEGLFPAEYLELWKKLYQKALGKQAFKIEIFTESANQENEMWTETNFNPIVSNNEVVAIACYSRNITERKKSEEIIKRNEQRLAEAQALAKVGNWETDLQTLVVTWSAETFRIFEVDQQEFKSSHPAFIKYVHPDDKDEVNKVFFDSFETKTVNVIEHRIITPKGNEKILEERWQIIRDKNNQPIRAVGTCQDITERKIAEIERTKITNDLIQRNRDFEQFAFIISHNLRAPTANIIGFSENLLNETLTPVEEKEFLKGLTISVNRLDGVIKDLNKIIQTRRETDGKKEMISFPALVKDISISIENVIAKNNVKFITDFSEISEFYSLKGYLHSIFFNLISNSIKYRKPTIEPVIEIRSKFLNGNIILIFQDNGLGIDLKTKGDKIFGLYKRFHSHVEGKGLGLFMVKTQIEALGATINISSEPNKGTMFTIEFQSQNKKNESND